MSKERFTCKILQLLYVTMEFSLRADYLSLLCFASNGFAFVLQMKLELRHSHVVSRIETDRIG